MSRMSTSNKGITLVETLFSAAILSMVMMSVLVVFVHTVDISHRVGYEYTATNLAKSRMERARVVIDVSGFGHLAELDETDTVLNHEGVADTDGEFKRTTSVTENYNGDSRLTRFDVTVEYKYRQAWKNDAAITISTVFSNIR
jgi:type II secretory pathway pseudopilin PulG